MTRKWVTYDALPYIDPVQMGAVGDGDKNDAAAIQAAMTTAGAAGTVMIPPGTYNIGTTTLTATGSVWMLPGASLLYSGTDVALVASTTQRCNFDVDIRRASVTWHTGVDTSSIGFRLLNSNYFRVRATVHNFNVGIDVRGDGTGSAYGVIDCVNVMDNKIGLRASAASGGWANQHEVRGQIRINGTYTGIAGSRYIDLSTAGNNWSFINMTLEANTPQYTAYIIGSYNVFFNCRFESATGLVYDGTQTNGCMIFGGYGIDGAAGFVPITLLNSSLGPVIFSSNPNGSKPTTATPTMTAASTTIAQMNGIWRYPTAPQFNGSGTSPAIHLGVNTNDPKIFRGTGDPNSVVTAGLGSLFVRSDGAAGTFLYEKEGAAGGSTGWVAFPSTAAALTWALKQTFTGEIQVGGALNHDGTTVGFYNVTPVTRPTAYTQTYSTTTRTHAAFTSSDITGITSSTTGSALAEPSAGYTQSEQQQNFRRIQDQFVLLRADLANLKQLVNSMIDDRQADGLAQ